MSLPSLTSSKSWVGMSAPLLESLPSQSLSSTESRPFPKSMLMTPNTFQATLPVFRNSQEAMAIRWEMGDGWLLQVMILE